MSLVPPVGRLMTGLRGSAFGLILSDGLTRPSRMAQVFLQLEEFKLDLSDVMIAAPQMHPGAPARIPPLRVFQNRVHFRRQDTGRGGPFKALPVCRRSSEFCTRAFARGTGGKKSGS